MKEAQILIVKFMLLQPVEAKELFMQDLAQLELELVPKMYL